LTRDSRDFVENGKKSTPCVKDILDGLAETNCDYMVYTNSDILFSDKFIKYILLLFCYYFGSATPVPLDLF
jgi:hypothetical protein